MKTSEYFVFPEHLPDISFKETSYGQLRRLECEECGDVWCPHLHYVMVNNLDSEFVWHGTEGWEIKAIHVPMFPTQNQWAVAVLEKLDAGYARLRLSQGEESESLPISYLHPGEGRNVIRTTFIDYMLGHRQTETKLECNSPAHKYKQEQIWRLNTSSRNKFQAAEFWCVWQNGMCLSCSNNNDVSEFDDLVPDDDRRRPWK